jgi:hypothetical protein
MSSKAKINQSAALASLRVRLRSVPPFLAQGLTKFIKVFQPYRIVDHHTSTLEPVKFGLAAPSNTRWFRDGSQFGDGNRIRIRARLPLDATPCQARQVASFPPPRGRRTKFWAKIDPTRPPLSLPH